MENVGLYEKRLVGDKLKMADPVLLIAVQTAVMVGLGVVFLMTTTTLVIDQTLREVFAAATNVRG